MEKVSFILPKLAIIALLIGTIVPIFGEGQMVMEEAIIEESNPMNVVNTDSCQSIYKVCTRSGGMHCCKGLYCALPPNTPPKWEFGICKASCAEAGQACIGSLGVYCCEGLKCNLIAAQRIGLCCKGPCGF